MNPSKPKRTALYDEHKKLGGKLIDFGGWELPVQYKGISIEHHACRNAVGLFDVSHMGEFLVTGSKALAFLQSLIPNDVGLISNGQALYSPLCHPSGGIVDDLLVYRFSPEKFLLVVNASNVEKDFSYVSAALRNSSFASHVTLTNQSSHYSLLALQGPKAAEVLAPLVDVSLEELGTYRFLEGKVSGTSALISRTGYTGEDGFELYLEWSTAPAVWNLLLEKGKSQGIEPCGLGARDTLRLEAKLPLYGHELDDETNPIEAGLSWTVKWEHGDFIGIEALKKAKEGTPSKKLIGLKSLESGIPRQGYSLFETEATTHPIGLITSGAPSPSLGFPIALGYVESKHSSIGQKLWVELRGRRIPVEIVKTPFYRRK